MFVNLLLILKIVFLCLDFPNRQRFTDTTDFLSNPRIGNDIDVFIWWMTRMGMSGKLAWMSEIIKFAEIDECMVENTIHEISTFDH